MRVCHGDVRAGSKQGKKKEQSLESCSHLLLIFLSQEEEFGDHEPLEMLSYC